MNHPRLGHTDLARERLRNQALDQRIRRLIDTANDAVVTIDHQSIILDWNSKAEAMFGWSRAEAVGRVLTELIVPTQHRAHHHHGLAKFLATGHQGILNPRVETTALTREGREFDVELSVWPVNAGSGYTFSSFIRDISKPADQRQKNPAEAGFLLRVTELTPACACRIRVRPSRGRAARGSRVRARPRALPRTRRVPQ